jgi:hypothetical protein
MNLKKFISAVLAATMAFSILGVTASADFEAEGGKTYYVVDGKKEKGFEKIDGDYYYFKQADGAMAKGWLKISGNWYYFSTKDGKMFAGKSYKIGGETYTFAADGKLAAYKAEGFLKGAWGDSNADLIEKIGETYSEEVGDSDVGGVVDFAPNWLKISSKTSAASPGMYITYDDIFLVGTELFLFATPTAEIDKQNDLFKTFDDYDYDTLYEMGNKRLTEDQLKTVYKLKLNEAERKCGEALPPEGDLYRGENMLFSPDDYIEATSFWTNDLIIFVGYDDESVVYCEVSTAHNAEAPGSEKFYFMFE